MWSLGSHESCMIASHHMLLRDFSTISFLAYIRSKIILKVRELFISLINLVIINTKRLQFAYIWINILLLRIFFFFVNNIYFNLTYIEKNVCQLYRILTIFGPKIILFLFFFFLVWLAFPKCELNKVEINKNFLVILACKYLLKLDKFFKKINGRKSKQSKRE